MTTTKQPQKKVDPATQPEVVDPQAVERYYPNSRANRIASLSIGESVSEAKRLDFNQATKDDIESVTANLKSTMSKAAVLAAQRCAGKFATETGQFLTRSNDLILVAVVTRTA